MPILDDNAETKNEEKNFVSSFKKNIFNENTANCCKSCFCYNQQTFAFYFNLSIINIVKNVFIKLLISFGKFN